MDKSRASIKIINKISQTVELKIGARYFGDWEHAIKEIPEPADIIILDPPYQLGLIEKCISK